MAYVRAASIVAAAALLSACGDTTLDYRNAEMSNGKVFARGENTPFGGNLTNFPWTTIRRTDGLNSVLAGLFGTLDRLGRQDESIRTLDLVCNGGIGDGYLDGEVSCYEPGTNTLRYQAHYKKGVMDGDFTTWGRHSNVLSKADFKNDVVDGQLQYFSPNNGKLILQTHSRDGLYDGLDQRWDDKTGQLTYQAKAEKGLFVGLAESWGPDGRKTGEVPYENGQINGIVRAWDPGTGQLIKETTFKNGVADGPAREWFEDGKIKSNGEFRSNVFYPAATQPDEGKIDKCASDYADEFHAQAGGDAPVNSEQLDEWAKWCQQGHPSI